MCVHRSLQRGAKFLKVPLFKGDLGGSAGVRYHTKKFSNNLLDIGELGDMSQTEIAFDASGRMTSSTLEHQESYRSLDSQNQQVCVAKLNPPREAGFDRISVLFEVDSRRTLLATVKDLLTGEILVNKGETYKLK